MPVRSTGALPRSMSRKPQLNLATVEERFGLIPESEWPSIYGWRALREHVKPYGIYDQDGVGSCVTEAGAMAVQVLRSMVGEKATPLQPWSIYQEVSGGVDRGSTLDDVIRHVAQRGIVPAEMWPRSRGWRKAPTDAMKAEAMKHRAVEFYWVKSKAEFITAIGCGYPVFYARDGHCILALDIEEDGCPYCNSWGADWSDDGYGFDPWNKFIPEMIRWGAVAVRTVCDDGTELPPELEG